MGEEEESGSRVRCTQERNVDFIGIMCGTTRHNVFDIIVITRTHRNSEEGGGHGDPLPLPAAGSRRFHDVQTAYGHGPTHATGSYCVQDAIETKIHSPVSSGCRH